MQKYKLLPIILLITGCANFAPKFERPELSELVTKTMPSNNVTVQKKLSTVSWKKFFTDKDLVNLINLALINNNDFKIAIANLAEAQGIYGIQKISQLPTGQANAGFSRTKNSKTTANGSFGGANPSNNYNVGLGILAYELDFWGRVRNLKDASLNSYLATVSAKQTVKISVISTTATTYYNLIAANKSLALLNQTLKLRSKSLKLIQSKESVGIATKLDVTQAQVSLETVRISQIQANNLVASSKLALELLVGKSLEEIKSLDASPKKLTKKAFSFLIPDNLPASILLTRPDVITAEYQLKSENAKIGVARAMFFPQINLVASIGLASSDLKNLFKASSKTWSFAPAISISPLFNRSGLQNNLKVAKARRDRAVAEYKKTIETAFSEVYTNLINRKFNKQTVNASKNLMKSQLKQLSLTNAKYKEGISNYLDVINAEQSLLNTKVALIAAEQLEFISNINLYKALGGGG